MGTTKGYTGQYADATGLDYYNARYYDPVVGRFISADIKQGNAQGMDPYEYVAGNPETLTDPTGQYYAQRGDSGVIQNIGYVSQVDDTHLSVSTENLGTGQGTTSTVKIGKSAASSTTTHKPQVSSGCNPAANQSDHCLAWAYKASLVRDKHVSDITRKADTKMLGGYVLMLLGDAFNFLKGSAFDRLDAVLDFFATVLDSVIPLLGHMLGNSGFYQAALQFSSWAMKAMAAIQGVVGALRSANWWVSNAAKFTANLALTASMGPAGIFMQGLMIALKPVVGYMLDAGAHLLQSSTLDDYKEAERENALPLQDWCVYDGGCPLYIA